MADSESRCRTPSLVRALLSEPWRHRARGRASLSPPAAGLLFWQGFADCHGPAAHQGPRLPAARGMGAVLVAPLLPHRENKFLWIIFQTATEKPQVGPRSAPPAGPPDLNRSGPKAPRYHGRSARTFQKVFAHVSHVNRNTARTAPIGERQRRWPLRGGSAP